MILKPENSHANLHVNENEMCVGIPDNNANGLTDGGVMACQGDAGGAIICDVDGKGRV